MAQGPGLQRERLEGGAFVIAAEHVAAAAEPDRALPLIDGANGARRLGLYLLVTGEGTSGHWSAGAGETVLYVLDGSGVMAIGTREFAVHPGCGVYVRTGETFSITAAGDTPLRVLAAVCPLDHGLRRLAASAGYFDGSQPDRVVDGALAGRHPTGDRFYKLLVGPSIGCRRVTQFVGHIPRSRAPEHYHDYEEALCVLSGSGRLWTGGHNATLGPGSVIFLPRRQPHSIESTDDTGIVLVGSFYPASSPAVSYVT